MRARGHGNQGRMARNPEDVYALFPDMVRKQPAEPDVRCQAYKKQVNIRGHVLDVTGERCTRPGAVEWGGEWLCHGHAWANGHPRPQVNRTSREGVVEFIRDWHNVCRQMGIVPGSVHSRQLTNIAQAFNRPTPGQLAREHGLTSHALAATLKTDRIAYLERERASKELNNLPSTGWVGYTARPVRR